LFDTAVPGKFPLAIDLVINIEPGSFQPPRSI
jgi:hypothetical protein